MAASMITDFAVPVSVPVSAPVSVPVSAAVAVSARVRPSRRITPEAGRALEILGHAIEYLTDELVHSGGELSPSNSELQAVQLLMERNRQVYYECPEAVTVGARLRSMLRLRAA